MNVTTKKALAPVCKPHAAELHSVRGFSCEAGNLSEYKSASFITNRSRIVLSARAERLGFPFWDRDLSRLLRWSDKSEPSGRIPDIRSMPLYSCGTLEMPTRTKTEWKPDSPGRYP